MILNYSIKIVELKSLCFIFLDGKSFFDISFGSGIYFLCVYFISPFSAPSQMPCCAAY